MTRKKGGVAGGAKLRLRDPNFRREFLTAITLGHNITEACRLSGIHDSTYRFWRQKSEAGREPYATFFADIERARAQLKSRLLSQMHRVAFIEQDPKLNAENTRWLLARMFPDEFGNRQRLTLAGDAANPLHATVELLRQAREEALAEEPCTPPKDEEEEE